MASTTFIDNQTIIYAAWLNDVNNAVYNGNFPNGILNPTTVNCTNLNATNAVITNLTYTASQIDFGNGFIMYGSGTKLYIKYLGTNVASLDSTGNFNLLGSSSTGTTP